MISNDQLLEKFEESTLNTEEKKMFKERFDTDDDFRESASVIAFNMSLFSVLADRNQSEVSEEQRSQSNNSSNMIYKIAGVLVVFIALSLAYLYDTNTDYSSQFSVYQEEIPNHRADDTDKVMEAYRLYSDKTSNDNLSKSAKLFQELYFSSDDKDVRYAYNSAIAFFGVENWDDAKLMFSITEKSTDDEYLLLMSRFRLYLMALDTNNEKEINAHIKYLRLNKELLFDYLPEEYHYLISEI